MISARLLVVAAALVAAATGLQLPSVPTSEGATEIGSGEAAIASPLAVLPTLLRPETEDRTTTKAEPRSEAPVEPGHATMRARSEPLHEIVDPPSPPRRIIIPSIEVDADVVDLGLASDGSLETPTDFSQAGWWIGGTVADKPGPTVIVGHVDDRNGPAVFYRLRELAPGQIVTVVDDVGLRTDFVVVDVELHDKDSFPTERVYGDTPGDPTVRLVTCGGAFDRSARSYESNWVVFAEAV